MPAGRPSKKESININQMKWLYLHGWDDSEVAIFFGITEQTINNWKLKDQKFFESLKEWKKVADERVERSLYERACGYAHPEEKIFQYEGAIIKTQTIKVYPPDTTACIFWLKNRQRDKWQDKVPEGEGGELINEDLEFKDIPENGEGLHRFKQFIRS